MANVNAHSEKPAINRTRQNIVQGSTLVPKDKQVPPKYVETNMGPWGWQWKDGMRVFVSAPPSPIRITVNALMDDIKKNAPEMYRTLKDSAYSRSPECPFIVDELLIADLRSRLQKYEKEKTLIPPDAQIGVRKSIAAALKEKRPVPARGTRGFVYPHPVGVGRAVDGLCGYRQPLEPFSDGKSDGGSGTMSMDLGTEDGTLSTPSKTPTLLKAVGPKVYARIVGGGRADSSSGRRL